MSRPTAPAMGKSVIAATIGNRILIRLVSQIQKINITIWIAPVGISGKRIWVSNGCRSHATRLTEKDGMKACTQREEGQPRNGAGDSG